MLHLFSGQRRTDDFQFHFEACLQSSPLPVICLSVDIAHHRIGDLTDPKSLALWIDLILLRVVIVSIGGPPCETWSVARMSALLEGPGPRPLRSIERLWGIGNPKPRELEQVRTGNDLLRAMIIVLYASKAAGAVAAMEHPAPPTWKPNAPSSFYLPELKWLRNLGEAGFDIFDKFMLGAPSVKPTALLHVNFPQVSDRIADMPNACRCDRSHQHISLIGHSEDGTFKTAPAKQYPGPMNHLLALSSVDFCKRRLIPGEPSWDDFTDTELAAFYVPLDPFCVDQQLGSYGADFSASSGLCNIARPLSAKPQFDEVGSATKTANASHARALQVMHSRSGVGRPDSFSQ